MSAERSTPISPKEKAAHRREEKRLLLQLAARAESLAQPGLDYAELYLGRILLAQTIRELLELG